GPVRVQLSVVFIPGASHQDGRFHLDLLPDRTAFGERRPMAEKDAHRKGIAFAHAIDRGIRDHRDSLVEEIAQIAANFRERGGRAVVTESGGRALARDRRIKVVNFLFRPTHRGERVGGGQGALDLDRALFPLFFDGQRVFGRFVFGVYKRGRLFDLLHFVFKIEGEEARGHRDLVEPVEVITLRRHFVDALLHPLVLEDHHLAVPLNQYPHLLAGRERPRVFGHRFQRRYAFFRRGEIFFLGLSEPERAQTQRVATENNFVAFARDDRGRPLRERSECAAEVAVERFEWRVGFFALAPDGREDDLDGLHQRQAVIEHQAFNDAVENLRITRARRQLKAERDRFARQPVNRVDLAVVTERRKHLRPFGRGVGVGRIASVAQRDRRFEFRLG